MRARFFAVVLCRLASAGDWRTARFWPAVEAALGPAPPVPAPRPCVVGAPDGTGCRGALVIPATYRASAAALESQAAFGRRLRRVLGHNVAVVVVTEPPFDEVAVRRAFGDFALRVKVLDGAELAAQARLPFWLRQWFKHAVAAREVAAIERRRPVDVVAKFRFDSQLVVRDDAAVRRLATAAVAEPDALWAQIEMQWVGGRAAVGAFLDALLADAKAPEDSALRLNGTQLRRWDRKPADAWFKMMAASNLMFPGFNGTSLDDLRASGASVAWTRAKPPFWPGVSSEELFVATALRRDLVLKDLGAVEGVEAATWLKDWMRWVHVDGCRLGNVVKLDGPRDAADFGDAAFDVKIYPEGRNGSRGRFNAYFTRNLTDAALGAIVTARVTRENPSCGPAKYVFGDGMLERIYPNFWDSEMPRPPPGA